VDPAIFEPVEIREFRIPAMLDDLAIGPEKSLSIRKKTPCFIANGPKSS
jgi:hypothetical protein